MGTARDQLQRVLELAVVHDLVEIDAGDTFAYDVDANVGKAAREQAAADRLFGLLPAEQAERVRALWDEFEAQATAESRYANALDRLQALLQNMQAGGGSWAAYGITRTQVYARMNPVQTALPAGLAVRRVSDRTFLRVRRYRGWLDPAGSNTETTIAPMSSS